MSENNQSALMKLLGDMSQNDDITSALAKLGKLLFEIPDMSANETAVLWHLVDVCKHSATTASSKQVISALRSSLWARMRQIIYMESSSEKWSHEDISQIQEIVIANARQSEPEKKLSWWQRILQAA